MLILPWRRRGRVGGLRDSPDSLLCSGRLCGEQLRNCGPDVVILNEEGVVTVFRLQHDRLEAVHAVRHVCRDLALRTERKVAVALYTEHETASLDAAQCRRDGAASASDIV